MQIPQNLLFNPLGTNSNLNAAEPFIFAENILTCQIRKVLKTKALRWLKYSLCGFMHEAFLSLKWSGDIVTIACVLLWEVILSAINKVYWPSGFSQTILEVSDSGQENVTPKETYRTDMFIFTLNRNAECRWHWVTAQSSGIYQNTNTFT